MNAKSKSKGAAPSPMIREAYVVGFKKNAELGAGTLSVVAINVGSRPVHKYVIPKWMDPKLLESPGNNLK